MRKPNVEILRQMIQTCDGLDLDPEVKVNHAFSSHLHVTFIQYEMIVKGIFTV